MVVKGESNLRHLGAPGGLEPDYVQDAGTGKLRTQIQMVLFYRSERKGVVVIVPIEELK